MAKEMNQITGLDYAVIVLYLLCMLGVGIHFVKRIKGEEDFYVADRSLGPMVLLATVCATIIGGSAMMGRAGKAYSEGFICVMTALPYMIGMFVFSGISGRIQQLGVRHEITSIPELMGKRFGTGTKILASALVAFAMMGTVAAQVSATATILKLVGGSVGISFELGAVIATVIFIIYTAASGLFGVVYTDVVQFFMLLIFVYLLIPITGTVRVGGLGNFWANLDKSFITPVINGSIIGDILGYLIFTLAGAEMWQRAFAARDRKSAQKGMFLGTSVYAVTIVLIFFMGLVGRQILPNVQADYGTYEAVIPALAIELLPAGVTGLALAGILSVMMSTADSYLLVSVQTCVHDIGKTISPGMSDKLELLLSRIFTVILAVGALIVALFAKGVYSIITDTFSYYAAGMGLPAMAALYWRKATWQGIISSMAGGLGITVLWKVLGTPFGLGATIPGILISAVMLIGVSLMTSKKSPSVFLNCE